ncbi:hypothetical protein [Acidithiobacillus ferriphilus]|uniref:hypothetical protein n=1 Tax=Acidithiobacillus ferriphilus TaxID=1689834 RepID=UPI001D0133DF|nr:hypothetical protein [Acidithiobacillus ferriphilus]MBU2832365.1 hypothetical protein [Acidithiobacillus ferriphilus]MDA8181060.1 hypothetical protein [Acidithiobacillus sp.]
MAALQALSAQVIPGTLNVVLAMPVGATAFIVVAADAGIVTLAPVIKAIAQNDARIF